MMSDLLRSMCFPTMSDADDININGPYPCPQGCCMARGQITCCGTSVSANPSVDYTSLTLPMGLALFSVLAVFLGVLYYYIFSGAEKTAATTRSGQTQDGQSESTTVSIDPPEGTRGNHSIDSIQSPGQPFRFVRSPPDYTEQDLNTTAPPPYLRITLPDKELTKRPVVMDVSDYLQAVTNSSPSSPPPSYEERRLSWGCYCLDLDTGCHSQAEARHCSSRRNSQASQFAVASHQSES